MRRKLRSRAGWTLLAAWYLLCLGASPPAQALTVDFEGLLHGEFVDTQFLGLGVTIAGTSFRTGADAAIIFNSLLIGTPEPDLEGPLWAGGNLPPATILGNLLIIPRNIRDRDDDGLVDVPEDEGAKPAGAFTIWFSDPISEFGLDLVDVEPFRFPPEIGFLEFFDGGASLGQIFFSDFTDPLSPFFDPSVVFGNNFANTISPITAAELGAGSFDKVVVHMGGSGAIDNLRFELPEPSVLLILGTGALGLAYMGRRRGR